MPGSGIVCAESFIFLSYFMFPGACNNTIPSILMNGRGKSPRSGIEGFREFGRCRPVWIKAFTPFTTSLCSRNIDWSFLQYLELAAYTPVTSGQAVILAAGGCKYRYALACESIGDENMLMMATHLWQS